MSDDSTTDRESQRERDKPLSDRRTPPATEDLLDALWWFAHNRTRHRNAVEERAREAVEEHGISESRVREIVREEMEGGDTGNGETDDGGGSGESDTGDGDGTGGGGLPWLESVGRFRSPPPVEGTPTRADADRVVAGAGEFLHAVRNAASGALIWVPGDADIHLSGVSDIDLPSGVTLASDRNPAEGRPGGRVKVTDFDNNYLFKTRKDNIRFTGLRLEGPAPRWLKEYDPDKQRAVAHLMGDNCRIDNCEVYGWPFAGFAIGARSYAPSHEIDHNHFHDNLMEGLGYGVELFNGHHDIHHNYFDRCRHAIAAFGYKNNGYRARFNVVGPEPLSHAFDMHALEESVSGGGSVAGGTTRIIRNLFLFTEDLAGRSQEAIAIRGVPGDHCYIRGNFFKHDGPPDPPGSHGDPFRQQRVSDWTNLDHSDNEYRTDIRFSPEP